MGHVCAIVVTLMMIPRMKPVMNVTILAINARVSPALIVLHVIHLIIELYKMGNVCVIPDTGMLVPLNAKHVTTVV
jgi:hypothetical protein